MLRLYYLYMQENKLDYIIKQLKRNPLKNIKIVCKLLIKFQKQLKHIPKQLKSLFKQLELINEKIYQDQNIMINYLLKESKYSFKQVQQLSTKQSKQRRVSNIKQQYINFMLNRGQIFHSNQQRINSQQEKMMNQVILAQTSHCIGCTNLKLNCHFTGQPCLSLKYDTRHWILLRKFMKSVCSLLNAGGGYLIINISEQWLSEIDIQSIKDNFQKMIGLNKSWVEIKYAINFIQLEKKKYIIRMPINPVNTKKIYFIQPEIIQNKASQIYFAKFSQKTFSFSIRMLSLQNFYQYSHLIYTKDIFIQICHENSCLKICPHRQKLVKEKFFVPAQLNDSPEFIYACNYLILINRAKSVQTISEISKVLNQKAIKHKYIIPYLDYNKKNLSSKLTYFMSSDNSFDVINNLLKKKKKQKAIQNEFTLINPTKSIQIPIADQNSAKKDQKKDKQEYERFMEELKQSECISKIQFQQCKQGKFPNDTSKNSTNICLSHYLLFQNLQFAIHSFIILCTTSLRGYFVKDHDF